MIGFLRIFNAVHPKQRMQQLAATSSIIEDTSTDTQQQLPSLSRKAFVLVIQQRRVQRNAPAHVPAARQQESSKANSGVTFIVLRPQLICSVSDSTIINKLTDGGQSPSAAFTFLRFGFQ